MPQSERVRAALRHAQVELDERGLMPLDQARALVQSSSAFRKGAGELVGGTFVLASDRLWAALLSLEDVGEFVREACRLAWYFHPRGQEDTSALDRYGVAILPWLRTFVRDDGRLVNIPWCVVPCLLAIDAPAVFGLLWKVHTVVDGVGSDWPGPFAADDPGDADQREGVNLTGAVPDEPDDDADGLVIDWASRHPQLGFPALAQLVLDGDQRATLMLRMLALVEPSAIFDHVAEGLGEEQAVAAFGQADAPTELDEECVLYQLYLWSQTGPWPSLGGPEQEPVHPGLPARRALHGLRICALRALDSEVWAVAFERLEGSDEESLCVHRFVMSPRHGCGHHEAPSRLSVDGLSASQGFDGVTVIGPTGPVELSNARVAELDLHPDRVTAAGVRDPRWSVCVRAYLTEHPGAFWTDPSELADRLGFEEPFEVVADSDAFEHALGTSDELAPVPGGYDAPWRIDPHELGSFQSLARAIVACDEDCFEPGEANTGWRTHARHPVGER